MKTDSLPRVGLNISLPLLALAIWISHAPALAQSTAFTYQGRLNDGGMPANGSYVFRFSLDDGNNVPVGSPITTPAVNVSNGLFTVTLDFGPGIFTGGNRNLYIEVQTNDNVSPFSALSPTQPIRPSPYAIYAGGVNAAGISGMIPAGSLSGTYSNVVSLTNVNNVFAGDGKGLTNVDAARLGGLSPSNFWQTGGNAGTTSGVNFLGTTDNQPLEIKVNGGRALRLEPTPTDANHAGIVNVVGGAPVNFVAPGVYGAMIGGGGAQNWGGASYTNSISADFGVIGGGRGNTIQTNAIDSTIGGGSGNTIQTYANVSTIGGGYYNTIQPGLYSTIGGGGGNTIQIGTDSSTIGGGYQNTIQNGTDYSMIGGGYQNTIQSGANVSTIGGGYENTIRTNALFSTIGGGLRNTIQTNAECATIPGGTGASARSYGQHVHASGGFSAVDGNAQTSVYVLRGTTTNSTKTELYLDGNALGSQTRRLLIPTNGFWSFDILVVANDGTGTGTAGYQIKGVIQNNSGNTTLRSDTTTILVEDYPIWNVVVEHDAPHQALALSAIGGATQTIRWVASVRTVELVNP